MRRKMLVLGGMIATITVAFVAGAVMLVAGEGAPEGLACPKDNDRVQITHNDLSRDASGTARPEEALAAFLASDYPTLNARAFERVSGSAADRARFVLTVQGARQAVVSLERSASGWVVPSAAVCDALNGAAPPADGLVDNPARDGEGSR